MCNVYCILVQREFNIASTLKDAQMVMFIVFLDFIGS